MSTNINAHAFLANWEQVAYPSPGDSTFLMITEGQTYLPWLRLQATQCS